MRLPNDAAPTRELGDGIATIPLYAQIPTDTPTRTKFQWFLSNPPPLLLKKLLVSTPLLP
jgi:hypothetical protein